MQVSGIHQRQADSGNDILPTGHTYAWHIQNSRNGPCRSDTFWTDRKHPPPDPSFSGQRIPIAAPGIPGHAAAYANGGALLPLPYSGWKQQYSALYPGYVSSPDSWGIPPVCMFLKALRYR